MTAGGKLAAGGAAACVWGFAMEGGQSVGLAFFKPFSSLIINSRLGWGFGVIVSGEERISMGAAVSPENSIELRVMDREKPAGVANLICIAPELVAK